MKTRTKTKQIVVRFDEPSYAKINDFANTEHRGLGEFVRHAALFYIEYFDDAEEAILTGRNKVSKRR